MVVWIGTRAGSVIIGLSVEMPKLSSGNSGAVSPEPSTKSSSSLITSALPDPSEPSKSNLVPKKSESSSFSESPDPKSGWKVCPKFRFDPRFWSLLLG